MTTKEMVIQKLRAAQAAISDAEWFVRNCSAIEVELAAASVESTETTENSTQDDKDGGKVNGNENENSDGDAGKTVEAVPFPEIDETKYGQTDFISALIPSCDKQAKPAKKVVHKRGAPTISYREAMANFRRLVGKRDLIDLGDVNEIFGYNKTTSGRFVQDSIRRGDIQAVKCGALRKFVSREIKAFVKDWYKQNTDFLNK